MTRLVSEEVIPRHQNPGREHRATVTVGCCWLFALDHPVASARPALHHSEGLGLECRALVTAKTGK